MLPSRVKRHMICLMENASNQRLVGQLPVIVIELEISGEWCKWEFFRVYRPYKELTDINVILLAVKLVMRELSQILCPDTRVCTNEPG